MGNGAVMRDTAFTEEQVDNPDVKSFIAAAAITKGALVMIDTSVSTSLRSQTVKMTDAVISCPIGAALTAAAAAGDEVKVVLRGFCPDVLMTASTAIDKHIGPSATAGTGVLLTAATERAVGVTIEAESGGTADCWIYG